MDVLGIDIGGSGIKGAPVDLTAGRFARDRVRIETPRPSAPKAVADVVRTVVGHFDWSGPVGVTFPGVVAGGITRSAAEMTFGAGRDREGVVLVLTFGTGIGSALFVDGTLVPNTELGHLELGGKDAEHRASAQVREVKGLSWEKWAERVEAYLRHVDALFSPGLIIIGGGVSKKSDKFLPLIDGVTAEVVPAALHNDAGIIGAAMAARGDQA